MAKKITALFLFFCLLNTTSTFLIGSEKKGLNAYCYNIGFQHATDKSTQPDPIGQGIDAFPCTRTDSYNSSYAQGFVDGMKYGNHHFKANVNNTTTNDSQSKK